MITCPSVPAPGGLKVNRCAAAMQLPIAPFQNPVKLPVFSLTVARKPARKHESLLQAPANNSDFRRQEAITTMATSANRYIISGITGEFLKDHDLIGKQDPYVIFEIGHQKVETSVRKCILIQRHAVFAVSLLSNTPMTMRLRLQSNRLASTLAGLRPTPWRFLLVKVPLHRRPRFPSTTRICWQVGVPPAGTCTCKLDPLPSPVEQSPVAETTIKLAPVLQMV